MIRRNEMTRIDLINEINQLMKPALELGFDWPSTELGFTDPNSATTEELIDFLYELELFIGNKEQ
jgi:hypothetical protein